MRLRICLSALLAATAIAASACGKAAPTGAEIAMPGVTFTATVAKAEPESANGPAGAYSQYDVWVVIPPGSKANAGVVVPASAPVFVRHAGVLAASSASAIRVGDAVEVSRDPIQVGYGAVQAPPGAPVFLATQVIVDR
jgi:hypothetical protein